jgi:DNA-binding transcriptional LysR family regulator
LLDRARAILDEVASATAAVHRSADGDAGTVRMGITPPVGRVLAPHLATALRAEAPGVDLEVRRMWLTDLTRAVAEGTVDVAITCGLVSEPSGVVGKVFCGEHLLVGLRADHRLANRHAIALTELADETLGIHSGALFPAWALAERQALDAAGVSPRTVELVNSDLSACDWPTQSDVDWVLKTASIAGSKMTTPIRPVVPTQPVPYALQWNPDRASSTAVSRFVELALNTDVPRGWATQRDHSRYNSH